MNLPDEPAASQESGTGSPVYPFSAVVGQDRAKEALLLAVINPAVHGVLFLGPKGTGKTTLVRSLNSLFPQRRIIELPIGSSEDMVLGAVDAEKTLTTGRLSVQPGILSRADRAVLYIDEVNLLPDHLVDIILDAAASGEYRLEREGLAATYPARFVLTIGTRHKTWDNLTASGECVINLPTVEALEQLWVCGHRTGHHGDKLGPAGIEVMPSTVVEAPRLTCCVAWIEAELVQAPLYEGTSLVLVEAVAVETVPGLIDEAGHLDVTRFHTLHHLGGPRFTLPGEVIEHK